MGDNEGKDGAAAPQEGLDDFNAAVAEIESSERSPAAAAAGSEAETAPPQAPTVETSPPADDAGGQPAAAGDPAPVSATSEDIWKDAPEALREAYQKQVLLNHRIKANLSASDRRLSELMRAQAAGPAPTPADGHSAQEQKGKSGAQEDAKAILNSDEIKQLREEYPEIAAPILRALESVLNQQTQLAAPIQVLTEAQSHADEVARLNELTSVHPDWRAWSHDPRWAEWAEMQPAFVQQAIERNKDVSDPQESAWVLAQFKAWAKVPLDPETGQPVADWQPPAAAQPVPAAPNPGTDAKRQRQLDGGRDGGSRGAGAVNTQPIDDFNATILAIEQEEKRAGQSRFR